MFSVDFRYNVNTTIATSFLSLSSWRRIRPRSIAIDESSATDSDELFLVSLAVSDGDINWVWQSEANATAFGTGGVVLADDGSPVVGGIAFGNQFNLTGEYWEVRSALASFVPPEHMSVVKRRVSNV